jgi:hypothetical protein
MKHLPRKHFVGLLAFLASLACASAADAPATARRWVPLFNGTNLDGWTVKIAGHPLGVNFADTFRVEDGMIKVAYDKYDKFGRQFGHLYSNVAYSHYILRMEYRFTGKMMPDAPNYVNLNSGVMIHAQSPQSMELNQGFPASLEVQFLADEGKGRRSTANVCTPGTNLEMGGKLITQHIVKSTAPTFPAEEWVRIEAEVLGNAEVIYRVNGTEVLRYQRPQLDPADPTGAELLKAGASKFIGFGHIALQAEGQPVWFRNIELMSLEQP